LEYLRHKKKALALPHIGMQVSYIPRNPVLVPAKKLTITIRIKILSRISNRRISLGKKSELL
jgi:hypothetical protein